MSRAWILAICLALAAGAQEQQQPDPQTTQRPVRPDVKEDDPGRPVLRRGGAAKKHEEVAPPESTSTNPAPAAPAPTAARPPVREVEVGEDGTTERVVTDRTRRSTADELVERAREAAFDFDKNLPNFLCDQLTNRYRSRTLKPDWKYQDRVQVELVYANNREDYRNIRINGKAVKKGSPEDSGTWSSGEFGTILIDVFHPNTRAVFKVRGSSLAAGVDAKVYDYSVLQENSHWQVRFGRTVKPAYKGAVWIDPKTARVLRIEMNTRRLPSDYEIDTVETVVDYGWVNISGQRFLLPVKSENLACFRGGFDCVRNEIEFRNYRKFAVESQIITTDSDISFPEAEDPKKEKSGTAPPSITPETPKPKTDPKKQLISLSNGMPQPQ
ncbi:hypothetical protein [Paludibaculum fermentans]|uniref:Outer membrane lipoprotein-sorting protein n=1 Tax=Paludibaculum fermentans TaxID=1473598 RepID=A0A7S7NWD8_PALFE|nr:hypothetical protein [Paludibaculum fermentans]QOY91025.1 hypothetical protein IRI77_14095 [Paludibaculum fermentans]